jgi:hypothetical protein
MDIIENVKKIFGRRIILDGKVYFNVVGIIMCPLMKRTFHAFSHCWRIFIKTPQPTGYHQTLQLLQVYPYVRVKFITHPPPPHRERERERKYTYIEDRLRDRVAH